ncbi:MAG: hypothetical protein NTX52_09365 [Planctomycetota bacterium]|nr:hypothetical protein [Planctomycetota bacterium]
MIKRVLILLAIMLPDSASKAGVFLTCSDLGDGVVELRYDSTQEAYRVSGFGLDIRVSSGVITSVGNLSSDYWVYPGSIVIRGDEVVDFGTPVADPNFPGTLGGLGTSEITIEMGALYIGEANAPPTTGVLLTFTVSAGCNVTVEENAYRGGVVLENSGTGTVNDPYLISTPDQMNTIGVNPCDWHKHFKLAADIDLSSYAGTDFNIVGKNSNNPFSGTFDGNNHRIHNFTYYGTDSNFVGLFGYVDGSNACIKNLYVDAPNVNAGRGRNVGSLVGCLKRGTISICCIDGGSVSGSDCVGGLVGRNYEGTITNCYARVDVLADSNVGGLVGRGYEMISNCYSTGSVPEDANIVGGLVGYNHGIVSNSFWDRETSGQENAAGGTGKTGVTDAMGETTSQMQTASPFTAAGWDFEGESANGTQDIWTIREGKTYPRFARQVPQGDVAGGEGVDMSDFAFFAGHWMNANCSNSNDCDGTDLDRSGIVDAADLMPFINNWLCSIP